uniref:Uncharacterized protein n=1 Tax=Oryza nivara TaxID=4536 RepID=A0A0E0GJH9_ORYNI
MNDVLEVLGSGLIRAEPVFLFGLVHPYRCRAAFVLLVKKTGTFVGLSTGTHLYFRGSANQ